MRYESKECPFCDGDMRKLYFHTDTFYTDKFLLVEKGNNEEHTREANVYICKDCGRVLIEEGE